MSRILKRGAQGMTAVDLYKQNLASHAAVCSLASVSMRDAFFEWMANGNSKKFRPESCLAVIDEVSEYAESKRVCKGGLWKIQDFSNFALIYERLKSSKLLRLTKKNAYRKFIFAGHLYMRFLKEKLRENISLKAVHPKTGAAIGNETIKLCFKHVVAEQLTEVLSSHFSNGYRLNSPIEMVRFRAFTEKSLGVQLMLSDDELNNRIAACGVTCDGKVYAVSTETKARIRGLAEEYFADGAQIIFFAEFYAKNESWLFETSVVSADVLVCILRELFSKQLSFTQTYFGCTDAPVSLAVKSEILRVWDSDVLLTYDQLAHRLPYIPSDRIKRVLGQYGDFIWNSVETFSHISRIEITGEERDAIRAAAVRKCDACGYVSVMDLPFWDIGERNYALSVTAVHNAIYRICLSDKFDKRGKIVTRKGDVFDALTIMKEYCRTIDKCSLEDLLDYEKELTGEIHHWIPMEAGCAILVRIDKDAYVADKYVHFNTDLIDEAIEPVMKGDYLPLKAFTAFSMFPDCGQIWNLFLLESYCRRFSRKFRFDTPSTNSRNAGAVIRKRCGMNYTEIMTDAVVNAGVPLDGAAIGRFLFDNGYIGKSTTAKAGEIIDKAKAMQGGLGLRYERN
jgi:hypothetical protein